MLTNKEKKARQCRQRDIDLIWIKENILRPVALGIKRLNPDLVRYRLIQYKRTNNVYMDQTWNPIFSIPTKHRMEKKVLLDVLDIIHSLNIQDHPTTCTMTFPICDVSFTKEYAVVTLDRNGINMNLDRINEMYRLMSNMIDHCCMHIISLYLAPYDYQSMNMIGPTAHGVWLYDEELYKINSRLSRFCWGNRILVNIIDTDDDAWLME